MICEACKRQLDELRAPGGGAGRLFKASAFGFVGGAIGSAIYYGILALTGYEIGLVAIVVGVLVGAAVRIGSEGRGGLLYQLLAVGLTYLSITTTYVPFVLEGMDAPPENLEAAATSDTPLDGEVANQEIGPAPNGAVGDDTSGEEVPRLLILIVAFFIAMLAPFLAGFENIIGIFIIGIALWEAWKRNRAVKVEISGPFQVTNV